jgi:hypothetical protein
MRKLPFHLGDIIQGVGISLDECEEIAVAYTVGLVIKIENWNSDLLKDYVTLQHYTGHTTRRSIKWYDWTVIKPRD